MTPKEKAEDLWYKFDEIIALNSWADEKTNIDELVRLPKKCALIAVDEISNELTSRGILSGFWYEVKQEIEKL